MGVVSVRSRGAARRARQRRRASGAGGARGGAPARTVRPTEEVDGVHEAAVQLGRPPQPGLVQGPGLAEGPLPGRAARAGGLPLPRALAGPLRVRQQRLRRPLGHREGRGRQHRRARRRGRRDRVLRARQRPLAGVRPEVRHRAAEARGRRQQRGGVHPRVRDLHAPLAVEEHRPGGRRSRRGALPARGLPVRRRREHDGRVEQVAEEPILARDVVVVEFAPLEELQGRRRFVLRAEGGRPGAALRAGSERNVSGAGSRCREGGQFGRVRHATRSAEVVVAGQRRTRPGPRARRANATPIEERIGALSP